MVRKITSPPTCHPERPYFAVGLCSQCYQAGRARQNRERTREQNRRYARKNNHKVREFQLRYAYGLEPGEYERMFASQNGRCAICQRQKKLCVDHCHTTDIVRGLLCHGCNVVVGTCENEDRFLPGLDAYLRRAEKTRQTKTAFSEAVKSCIEGADIADAAAQFRVKPAKLKKGFELAVHKKIGSAQWLDHEDCLLAAKVAGEAVHEAVQWFLGYFRDPADCCPHDGREGGFQYLWGGPYTAFDGLELGFDELEEDDLFECLEILEKHPLEGVWSGPPENNEEVDNNS